MIQNINLKLINCMYQDHQNIYILIVLNYRIKIMSLLMVIFIILFQKLLAQFKHPHRGKIIINIL